MLHQLHIPIQEIAMRSVPGILQQSHIYMTLITLAEQVLFELKKVALAQITSQMTQRKNVLPVFTDLCCSLSDKSHCYLL